jgi:hypothetical protein
LAPTQMVFAAGRDVILQNSAIATRGAAFQTSIPGDFLILGSQLYSDNFMAQDAAPIRIEAQNILFDRFDLTDQTQQVGNDVGISSNSVVAGRAADIVLTARNNLRLQTKVDSTVAPPGIGSNTLTNASAGNIILTAGNRYEMDIAGIGNQSWSRNPELSDPKITGNNGQLIITAKTIDLNRFGFNMDHFSQGGDGQIVLNASEDIILGEGGIGTNGKGAAQGAAITVNAGRRLVMQPRSALSTLAEKQSQGGNITVNSPELLLQGSISTSTNGEGNAGNILVNSQQIELNEQRVNRRLARGAISSYTGTSRNVTTVATGNSGQITIDTVSNSGKLVLRSGAGIANTVFNNSTGNAGAIIVRAGTVDVQGGSQILSATNSSSNTGLINVQASQGIQLIGRSTNGQSPSGILSTIQASTAGASSQGIQIRTPNLTVSDGAGIIASTTGSGNSGKVEILADQATFSGQMQGVSSGVLTSVGLNVIPTGNVISLNTNDPRFTLITLNPLLVDAANSNVTGNSGEIQLTVGSLDLNRGAKLVTAILGEGKAGNIAVQANSQIRLSDQAAIQADSGSGQGGSINLSSDRGALILRRGSTISAVSRKGGQDGNIKITVPFIVGRSDENSDIFAVSQTALNGGRSVGNNVEIDATGILGFAYRDQFTSQNDIIATGQVTLNLPDIDPSRGLNSLEIAPIDVAQNIDRRCNPDSPGQSSSFTSRGDGLPASPNQPNGPDSQLIRLAQLPPAERQVAKPQQAKPGQAFPIEAQTSTRLNNGKIRLQATSNVPAQINANRCLVTP